VKEHVCSEHDHSNCFDLILELDNQMMAAAWIQKQCVAAWVLDFQIKIQSFLLDSVWIVTSLLQ
jgi:hypothetical protein